jgi:hypothetical protein
MPRNLGGLIFPMLAATGASESDEAPRFDVVPAP